MSLSIAYKYLGPTVAISVSIVASGAVAVSTGTPNDMTPYAAFLNTGTTLTACTLDPANAPTPVFPVNNSTAQPVFVLAAGMTQPQIIAVPTGIKGTFSVNAITNSSVAPVLYVTPVASL